MKRYDELCDFELAALKTLIWTATGSTEEGDEIRVNDHLCAYEIWDMIEENQRKEFVEEAEEFYAEYGLLFEDDEQAGCDWILTRQRQGAGFWDGDYEHGEQLTQGAHDQGSIELDVWFRCEDGETVVLGAQFHG